MTTQFATASYQEIIDLHTETDKVSVLGIHTPTSNAPYAFLQGFFDAFQKYHYDGCSMALVPAARLPADPSQVSYGAGSQPIDPRDLLNPILFHGAHGESLGSVLNQFYAGGGSTTDVSRHFSDSVDFNEVSQTQVGNDVIWQSLYYRALSDNSWKKAHPQAGLRIKGMHPLVYAVGANAQYSNQIGAGAEPRVMARTNAPRNPDENNGTITGTAGTMGPSGSSNALNLTGTEGLQFSTSDSNGAYVNLQGSQYGTQFFTERLHGLGWLDTRVRTIPYPRNVSVDVDGGPYDALNMESLYEQIEDTQKTNYLPRLFMGICLLPPAYKAEQYYRLVLNHRFSFRKFRGLSTRGDIVGSYGPGTSPGYTNFNYTG